MADWTGAYIAVDWGTTNRRAYAVTSSGKLSARFEDDLGALAVAPGQFAAAVAEVRARLGDAPMLLAGMIGSNRGWIEVPYVGAPVTIADLASSLHWVSDDIAIVPGVRTLDRRCDIMRGEEMQALGAIAAGHIAGDAQICHPGTHAKWIQMSAGAIHDFRTAMPGELFALLKAHSILQLAGEVAANEPFLAGVDLAFSGEPLLDALFSTRSRVVLGALDAQHTASFASGLLIGTDVAAHARPGDETALLGRPELCELYAHALARRGCRTTTTDGAEAFVGGMSALRSFMI